MRVFRKSREKENPGHLPPWRKVVGSRKIEMRKFITRALSYSSLKRPAIFRRNFSGICIFLFVLLDILFVFFCSASGVCLWCLFLLNFISWILVRLKYTRKLGIDHNSIICLERRYKNLSTTNKKKKKSIYNLFLTCLIFHSRIYSFTIKRRVD